MPKSFLKNSLEGFHPYVPGEQPPDREDWVKLNTNEAPLPPSPKVIEAVRAAAGDSLRLYPSPSGAPVAPWAKVIGGVRAGGEDSRRLYPSASGAPARRAIAKHFDLDPAQVALGNGGDELIEMCFRAFAGKGDRVAYPTPTYPLFEPLCRIHEVVPAPQPSAEAFTWSADLVDDPAPLKFLVNPNSPTGTWHGRASVERILMRSEGLVVLDEAYVDFAIESQLALLARHQNLLILRTMSKAYALAC